MRSISATPLGLMIPFDTDLEPDAEHPVLRGYTGSDFLAYIDRNLTVRWVNRSVAELAGMSQDDLAGQPCRDVFGSIEPDCEECRIQEVLEYGTTGTWDRRLGDGRTISVNAYPSFSDWNRPDGVLIVGRDVSDRLQHQRELERSNSTVEGVFAAAPVGIGIAVGRVLQHVNDKLCTMTGYSREELLGGSVARFYVSEEEYRAVGEYKYPILRRDGVCTLETQFRTKEGEVIDVLMRSAAIERENLDAGVIFTVLDITGQKETQQALERAVKQKDMLLREVHHRSKNNMQIISSLLNLESERAGREDVSGPLQKMRARIRSMALVHEKLYQSEDLERVDLAEYTEKLSSEIVSLHGAALERTVRAEAILVDIDFAVPFGLILNELLTNSLQHGFDAGDRGAVDISVRRDREMVRLTLHDTGHGVPEGFDVRAGSSLGLHLVSALVDQLHGAISVENDGGTRWQIELTDVAYLKEHGPSSRD